MKHKTTSLLVALCLLLLVLTFSPSTYAADAEADEENSSASVQRFIESSKNRFGSVYYTNVHAFDGDGPASHFIDLAQSGYDSGPGDTGLQEISSNHLIIQSIAPILFPLLIPFYELAILLMGIYYIWGAVSPASRAAAKNQIFRLIVGMILCSLSLEIFDFLIELQVWVGNILIATDPGMQTFGIADLYLQAQHIIIPVGITTLILIIIFMFITGPLGLLAAVCMGPMVLMAIILPLVTPYMILIMRYIAVLMFGAMFPLTMFLISFDLTKGLGMKILRTMLAWIFVPIVCIIIALIMLSTNLITTAPFAIGAMKLALLLLMGAAPMMIMGLMSSAGGMVLHAGRVKSDPRIMFLGHLMQGAGASSITNVAFDQAYMARSGFGPSSVAKQMEDSVNQQGSLATPSRTPSWAMSKSEMEAETGKMSYGQFVKERAKRLLTGKKVAAEGIADKDRYRYMDVGERSRAYISEQWAEGKRGRAIASAALLVPASILHRAVVKAPLAAVGETLKALPVSFLHPNILKKTQAWADALSGRVVRHPTTGKLVVEQGAASFKNILRHVSETYKPDKDNPNGSVGAGIKRGITMGAVAAGGISVAAIMLPIATPITLGVVAASFAAGAGLTPLAAALGAKRRDGSSLINFSATQKERDAAELKMRENYMKRAGGHGKSLTKKQFGQLKDFSAKNAGCDVKTPDERRKELDEQLSSGKIDKKTHSDKKKLVDAHEKLSSMSYEDAKNLDSRSDKARVMSDVEAGKNREALETIDKSLKEEEGKLSPLLQRSDLEKQYSKLDKDISDVDRQIAEKDNDLRQNSTDPKAQKKLMGERAELLQTKAGLLESQSMVGRQLTIAQKKSESSKLKDEISDVQSQIDANHFDTRHSSNDPALRKQASSEMDQLLDKHKDLTGKKEKLDADAKKLEEIQTGKAPEGDDIKLGWTPLSKEESKKVEDFQKRRKAVDEILNPQLAHDGIYDTNKKGSYANLLERQALTEDLTPLEKDYYAEKRVLDSLKHERSKATDPKKINELDEKIQKQQIIHDKAITPVVDTNNRLQSLGGKFTKTDKKKPTTFDSDEEKLGHLETFHKILSSPLDSDEFQKTYQNLQGRKQQSDKVNQGRQEIEKLQKEEATMPEGTKKEQKARQKTQQKIRQKEKEVDLSTKVLKDMGGFDPQQDGESLRIAKQRMNPREGQEIVKSEYEKAVGGKNQTQLSEKEKQSLDNFNEGIDDAFRGLKTEQIAAINPEFRSHFEKSNPPEEKPEEETKKQPETTEDKKEKKDEEDDKKPIPPQRPGGGNNAPPPNETSPTQDAEGSSDVDIDSGAEEAEDYEGDGGE